MEGKFNRGRYYAKCAITRLGAMVGEELLGWVLQIGKELSTVFCKMSY